MEHLSKLPTIIKELVDNDIEVVLTKEGYRLGGFYKSGTMLLVPYENGQNFMAVDRYGSKKEILELEDIVSLNFYWWIKEHQTNPNPNWLPLLEKFNFVKVRQVTTTIVERKY